MGDTQLGAGVAPVPGAVAAAVVREHRHGGDAAGAEPCHRPVQDADGSGGVLVVVDLGDPGVVIDDMHELVGAAEVDQSFVTTDPVVTKLVQPVSAAPPEPSEDVDVEQGLLDRVAVVGVVPVEVAGGLKG